MIVFGITGGTGSGKSSVSDAMSSLGVYVIDADKTARAVCEKGMPCLEELTGYFGGEIIDDEGNLKRRVLGDIVFRDAKKLSVLNEITHRYINNAIRSELESIDAELAAIDGAVIIGSPVESLCRFVVSVLADKEIRLARIMKRDGISEEGAKSRIASQPNDEFYINRSRYVIYNNGSAKELAMQASNIVKQIRETEFE